MSLKGAVECALLPSDISSIHFYFWDFLEESISAGTPDTIKGLKLKDTSVGELSDLLSQISDKTIAVLRSVCLRTAKESSNMVIYSRRC